MNRMKKMTKAAAVTMAGILTAQTGLAGIYAADTKDDKIEKEETVYVKTDASGNSTEVIVSDWLKNTGKTKSIVDETDLSDIENVKGEESFKQDGKQLTWNADGKDIYYQGTTNKELPVTVKVTYYLDGKEISPDELAGKSGHVKIEYTYVNNAKQGDVYTPFAMVTGLVFPSENFSNVTVSKGKVISDGERDIVIGMGMPGLSESLKLSDTEFLKDVEIPEAFSVEADVEDFYLTISMTAAEPLNLEAFGLDDVKDGEDLKESLKELSDASEKLVDGSGELADGVQTLKDSCRELIDGMDAVDENMGTLANGIKTLNTKKGELIDGITALADGIETLDSKKGELVSGVQQLYSGGESLKNGAKQVCDGAAELNAGANQLNTGASSLSDGSKVLLDGSSALLAGAGSLKTGSESLAEGTKSLNDGLNGKEGLAAGSAALLSGADTLSKGTVSLENGSAALKDGVDAYTAGVGQAIQGVQTYVQGVSGYMDGVHGYEDGVQSYIDGTNTYIAAVDMLLSQLTQNAETSQAKEAMSNETGTTEDTRTVVTIDAQSVANIQAVLSTLLEVQGVVNGISVPTSLEQVQQLYGTYSAYVGQLSVCISELNAALGGIQETTVTTASGQNAGAAEQTEVSAVNAEQLQAVMQALNQGKAKLQAGQNSLGEAKTQLDMGEAKLQAGISGTEETSGLNTGLQQLT